MYHNAVHLHYIPSRLKLHASFEWQTVEKFIIWVNDK